MVAMGIKTTVVILHRPSRRDCWFGYRSPSVGGEGLLDGGLGGFRLCGNEDLALRSSRNPGKLVLESLN